MNNSVIMGDLGIHHRYLTIPATFLEIVYTVVMHRFTCLLA